MDKDRLDMNRNEIAQFLDKMPEEFTKRDIIRFCEENGIEMVNFRYVAGDGRLKTLNFVITSKADLDRLLSTGERVDGSSLFSYVDAAASDLYVIPRYKTAFVNPFSEIPAIDILCSYYTSEGVPLASAPENIVRKAHDSLKRSTGLNLEAMGELEYYVLHDKQSLYPTTSQRGYHESAPFAKFEEMRCEAMHALAQTGARIKYGHSEVGSIHSDIGMEQGEIELSPIPVEDAADQLVVAKWILRMIGYRYGVTVTFAPKIMVGHAGSGLHIHTRLMKNGKSVMVRGKQLSDYCRKAIAGYLTLARSLTAFGNTVPISYLRLVPHQEAPTNICWGDRNRSVLVRVPLGWVGVKNMIKDANPQEKDTETRYQDAQTVEFRASDGSANVHLLLAGLTVATRHGLEMANAMEVADKLYVGVNIFADEHKEVQKRLPQLPRSCWESADCLLADRAVYEKDNVFTPLVIDGIAKQLKDYQDEDLSERLYGKEDEIRRLVEQYVHCA